MDHHQHVDVLVDVIDIRRDRPHRENLLELGEDGPRIAHAAAHGIELALHAQGTHEADHRLLRRAQFVDEFRHVVLEEFLAFRLKARDRRAAVRGVGAGQTEIQSIAAARLQRLQAEFSGAIFILRKRLRIDDTQVDLAAGAGRDFLQEFAHPRRIRHEQRGLFGGGVARKIVVQVDGLLELGEHGFRAGRQCVEPVLREIEAHAAQQPIRQHDDAQKEHRQGC